jgi:alpha/beta superfamily hydrolase
VTVEEIRFPSGDGTMLEGELAAVPDARGGVVLCHPHPQYGGSMRAGIIGDLFRALPDAALTTLRFNFRGVEGSEGSWDEGRAEQGDATAAVDTLATAVPPSLPVVLVGWSFGADMALSVHHPRIAGWCAIAPPLHFAGALDAIGADPRPKHVILGEHDEVVSAARVREIMDGWRNATLDVIPGASHFFVGRSVEVVATVERWCAASFG